MGVERVDYYSEEEYRQAKMMEEQERREQEKIQRAMEEEMAFEQLLGEFRELKKIGKQIIEKAVPPHTSDDDIYGIEGSLLEKLEQVINK